VREAEERFLDALYRGVTDGDKFGDALKLIQDMFGCRGVALVAVDSQDPTANLAATAGLMAENLQLYTEKFAALDPAPAMFTRIPAGTANATDRMFTPEQLSKDRFYQEFFLPIGLVETLGGHIYSDRGNFSLIGLIRGADRKPFDDEDIANLERLIPHMARALQLRQAFFRVDAKSLGLQATANRLSAGLVLLDEDGNSVFINAAMQAIAQSGDGLALDRGGRPLPINIAARQRFDALLKKVNGGGAGGILSVPRDGLRNYVVMVAPAPSSSVQSERERQGPAGAIVLVHDPEIGVRDAVEILEQGLRLPNGAARVVAALAGDDDLKSFAKREGVTIHTARFHLRAALTRTGARNQAEVVRLAVRLLRDVALSQTHR
jgi:PAS domain-containing protein